MTKPNVKTVDLTPSWEGILPVLLTIYNYAETAEARNTAFAELKRMAQLADAYVAEQKRNERKTIIHPAITAQAFKPK